MLYIVRHGQTDWNAIRMLQGNTDIPLNDVGRQMARDAAAQLEGIHLDVCYCSPLVRAKETAQLLLEGRDIPIIYDDRIREMCYGKFEGVKYPYGDTIYTYFKHPENYHPDITDPDAGAETFDELFARTGEFLAEVIYPQLDEGKDIIIVGHGGMNSSIVCQIRNLPIEEYWSAGIENCKVMRLI